MTDFFDACEENKALVIAAIQFVDCASQQPEMTEQQLRDLTKIKTVLLAFPKIIQGVWIDLEVKIYDEYLKPWVEGRVEEENVPIGSHESYNVSYDTSSRLEDADPSRFEFSMYKFVCLYPRVSKTASYAEIEAQRDRDEDQAFSHYFMHAKYADPNLHFMDSIQPFLQQLSNIQQFITPQKIVSWSVEFKDVQAN